jgi:pimeloyl-ACP methyl ester carboxylesterase
MPRDRRLRALLRLLDWLGPQRDASAMPRGIAASRFVVRAGSPSGRHARRAGAPPSGRPFEVAARTFEPRGPRLGSYLVVPGLHFDGPDDPRLERFCRILAHAGFRVIAPFLPAHSELLVDEGAADDLEAVLLAAAEREPGERFTLFSISFGSTPALEVAARRPDLVDAVITFGGYADFEAAVRFAVDGRMRLPDGDVQMARDPLNQPALFLNVLPWLDVAGDTRELGEAWRQMVYRTWGRMELKEPGRLEPFAEELEPRVPAPQRELFLVGCGVRPGGAELVDGALARAAHRVRALGPARALGAIARPVVVCHGRDDDVIPWNEAEKLYAALSQSVPARLYITGLYGHTGATLPSPAALARELGTLLSVARALSMGGRVAEWVVGDEAHVPANS